MGMRNFMFAIIAVAAVVPLAFMASASGHSLQFLSAVVIPYLAFAIFVCGVIYKILIWAASPVPFRIPLTCGQEKSLPWIKRNPLENPEGIWGVIARMFFEVSLFRSLFRNTTMSRHENRVVYGSSKWLWFFALLFHWSFLMILLRHLRLFAEPIPAFVSALCSLDGFFEIGTPALNLTDATLLLSLSFLFLRRILFLRLRYISLIADYFPLFMVLSIAISGIWMRHVESVDVHQIKSFALSLASFAPSVPTGLTAGFFVHLFSVCALFIWFPFGKLMHAGGIFFSPTRNLINNSRARRHINPWNVPVKIHAYEEYENEFRAQMKATGIPVEKE